MIRLGVNIDHGATMRQARYRDYEVGCGGIVEPDPLMLATEAERAGADGITVHPREDGRHIQRFDVVRLKQHLQIPLNMEMAATEDMLSFALEVRPHIVCLVPEKREEVTTEGGLDVASRVPTLRKMVSRLHDEGIAVSLFIDPDPDQVAAAVAIGSRTVELHTGAYANTWGNSSLKKQEYERISVSAKEAQHAGIVVNLGHGINYSNVLELREIPGVHEMNIGHSILSRALFVGIGSAVRDMRLRMNGGAW